MGQHHTAAGTALPALPDHSAIAGSLFLESRHPRKQHSRKLLEVDAGTTQGQLPGAPTGPASITVVTTALQLAESIHQGAEHIEVREHLNFWNITPRGFRGIPQATLLANIPPSVRSIQVRTPLGRACALHKNNHL
eukprot:jgi/Ulvmu1/12309/UM088_0029.1